MISLQKTRSVAACVSNHGLSDLRAQGEIEKVLLPMNDNIRVPITGSGRTDTGVHAIGQVAHFDLETSLNEEQLLKAMNARLKNDIRIEHIIQVNENFHARYSALKRYYHYQCLIEFP